MHYDTIIIGGSFAGLAAALYLARARKSVCILDNGRPRNRFATHSHGFFAHDGSVPGELLSTMRKQVAAYPSVTFLEDAAVDASLDGEILSVRLQSGAVITAPRTLLAFGISDTLPDLPGVAERWGRSVLHCPYCHGYEFSDQQLGVLNLMEMSHHQAALISEWGPTTFYLNGGTLEPEAAEALERRGVTIEPAPVVSLHGEGHSLSGIELADGRSRALNALFIAPRNHFNSPIAEQLGCEVEATPLGSTITVDALQMTSIRHVYAAGDITRQGHSITFACADGVMAGTAIHRSLAFDA
ncbi:thioredoxin reductase [Devosia pacifica]|uniref:Thioredoxin reductase n=1 Tax=Devosia pacifica TaxID=1335967 RepID=A0A918VSY9_9HYPH|nr:NAD(P)/FAD-dependent oxidoreductase [Devosia pacifica]GHA21469.1 thioredoxin reductase [Devosia pacifica]